MSQQTVTVNGTIYDAHTGMPITPVSAKKPPAKSVSLSSKVHHSASVHQVAQKSHTLNRRIVEKTPSSSQSQVQRPRVQKSPAITKFAPHPLGVKQPRVISDVGPTSHLMATKAQHMPSTGFQKGTMRDIVKPATKPPQVIKQEAISKALAQTPHHNAPANQTKKSPRVISIISASFALLLLGGYFTYLNMPNLSVRVAAAQAGVNATYPEYRPDGYSLRGPVAYNQGEVTMKFAANAGPQNFTVNQTRSAWDSSAVLDNYVKEKAGDKYITYNERGLTIYTFDGNAAWVNNGTFYTISGDAPLSSDQIRRLATSM